MSPELGGEDDVCVDHVSTMYDQASDLWNQQYDEGIRLANSYEEITSLQRFTDAILVGNPVFEEKSKWGWEGDTAAPEWSEEVIAIWRNGGTINSPAQFFEAMRVLTKWRADNGMQPQFEKNAAGNTRCGRNTVTAH